MHLIVALECHRHRPMTTRRRRTSRVTRRRVPDTHRRGRLDGEVHGRIPAANGRPHVPDRAARSLINHRWTRRHHPRAGDHLAIKPGEVAARFIRLNEAPGERERIWRDVFASREARSPQTSQQRHRERPGFDLQSESPQVWGAFTECPRETKSRRETTPFGESYSIAENAIAV